MTIFVTLLAVLQSIAISLGVGSSTLAIINFFAAIADGTIDETERRMMGVVYVVLRVAMVLIFVTTAGLIALQAAQEAMQFMPVWLLAAFVVTSVLFINALLMTRHLVPSTIGPGIQAGSWYALGLIVALTAQGVEFTLLQASLGYLALVVLVIGLVNFVMAVLKARKSKAQADPAPSSQQ